MKLPQIMRAVLLTGHGGLNKLVFNQDYPLPTLEDNEVLIKVSATGMNNTDINTRIGWYSKAVSQGTTQTGGVKGFEDSVSDESSWGRGGIDFPRIQGADICGRVVAAKNKSDASLIGKRVMIDPWFRDWGDPLNTRKTGFFGSECDGGYAQYTKAPVNNVHAINSSLSDIELASFATSYITAENMLERANVSAGERVLITGASGGVGSALIQLVKRRCAIPIAVSSEDKFKQLKSIGAVHCLSRNKEDLATELKDATGLEKVDVVADVVGGDHWPQLLEMLIQNGRYSCAGAIAGPIVKFDLRTFYLKDLSMFGATIVPPGLFAKLIGYIERNEIIPLVAATFPLQEIHQAQMQFLSKSHIGNIVITI